MMISFGTVTADLTGDVTGTVSSLSNHTTDNLQKLAKGRQTFTILKQERGFVSVTDSGGDGSLQSYNSLQEKLHIRDRRQLKPSSFLSGG